MTFAIYKQQDGGAPVWMETQNVTTDAAAITASCWAAPRPPVCRAISSRNRSSAGWASKCRVKPSSRAC